MIHDSNATVNPPCPRTDDRLGASCVTLLPRAAMHKITTLDDHWMARPRSIGTALLESDGHHAMVDPSKLLASAARLWPDNLGELFGEAVPVPESNLQILEGRETITLGSRKIEVAYTPGHAAHHVSYFEDVEGVAFVGDTTGIGIEGQSYVMPATPPPDIDLPLWDSSFARILERKPNRLFLTHFGFSENPAAHIAQFRERLHGWMET